MSKNVKFVIWVNRYRKLINIRHSEQSAVDSLEGWLSRDYKIYKRIIRHIIQMLIYVYAFKLNLNCLKFNILEIKLKCLNKMLENRLNRYFVITIVDFMSLNIHNTFVIHGNKTKTKNNV